MNFCRRVAARLKIQKLCQWGKCMEQRENFPPGHVRLPIGTASQRRAGAKGPHGRRFATVNTGYKQRSRAFRPAPLFIRGPIRSFPNRIEYAMPTGRHGIIAQCKRQSRLLTLNDGRQVHRACCCGIITAERLLYQSYGQGDTRARPAFAPMVDYTMPLRGHGIIYFMRCVRAAVIGKNSGA